MNLSTMSKRGGKPICSPQIGAGAGFDTKLKGKTWTSETTIEDTIDVVGMFDIVPLVNIGLCDLGCCNPQLQWEDRLIEKNSQKITKEQILKTPVGTLILSIDCPDKFKKLMNKIVLLDEKLLHAVAKGGADFVFIGAPGAEMLSPFQYENYIIPYSKTVISIVHSLGLMVYSHICSPIEPFLTNGYYNRMGIDLFETLSPPPVGNVASLKDAFDKIDSCICTRGNIGLDVLLNSEPEVIKEEIYKIMESAKGRKHMVAASDYLFYQVPEENVHAMCEAVRVYNGS